MKKYYIIICSFFLSYPIAAQDFSAIDSFFSELIEQKQLAGAITLVARKGEILHFSPYGYMDIERSVPMDKNAIIPIASMTKVMTSIGILILQEDGKLHIDDPVVKYLPQFHNLKVYMNPDSKETESLVIQPTIKHLLTHTAGFLYGGEPYNEAGFKDWRKSLPEFIDKITSIPLAFQPGINWKYSYSHDILGYLIEEITGTSINQFLKEELFIPLGMDDTDFYVPRKKINQLSNLYVYENNQLKEIDSKHTSVYSHLPEALSGGGGWYDSYGGVVSTVSDFYLLANWLLNYDTNIHANILTSNSLKMMITNQIGELLASGKYKYGLGVGVTESKPGESKEIFWSGSPYNTYFWIDYEQKEIGILFTNTSPYGHLNMMNEFKNKVSEAN